MSRLSLLLLYKCVSIKSGGYWTAKAFVLEQNNTQYFCMRYERYNGDNGDTVLIFWHNLGSASRKFCFIETLVSSQCWFYALRLWIPVQKRMSVWICVSHTSLRCQNTSSKDWPIILYFSLYVQQRSA